jgi:hypothetical protein
MDSGWKSPTASGDPHNHGVVNPTYAYSSDDTYAEFQGFEYPLDYISVQVSSDGTNYYPSTPKQGVLGTTEVITVLGSNADTWGKSWSKSEFATFRVFLFLDDGLIEPAEDYEDYSFALPYDITIDGIEVSIEGYYIDTTFIRNFKIDHIQAKIYYTQYLSPLPTFKP